MQVNPSSSHTSLMRRCKRSSPQQRHEQAGSRDNILLTPAAGDLCWLQNRSKGQHQPSPGAKGDGRLKSQPGARTAHKQPCTVSVLTSSISSRWANSAAHNQPSPCQISSCLWWEGQTLLLPWANAWDHTEEGMSTVQSSLGWNRAVCKTSHFT